MNDLDQLLHDGLRVATDQVDDIDARELARRLDSRRAREVDPPEPSRLVRWLGAAAALALLFGGAAIVRTVADGDRSRQDVVADDLPTVSAAPVGQPAPVPARPAPGTPLHEWEPGWYQIDTSTMPSGASADPVWFEGDLVVTAMTAGQPTDDTRVFRRAQDGGAWSELPRLPIVAAALVVAGDQLVAVGMEDYRAQPLPPVWAVLSEDGDEWILQGRARPDPSVAMSNYMGPSLVWTGERVLDLADAVVLDPATGRAESLEVPDEVELALHSSGGVWTGERVVAPRWAQPGWAWDEFGRYLGEIPAAAPSPAAAALTGELSIPGTTLVLDGSVVMTAAPASSSTAVTRRLPPGASRWEEAPAPPVAQPTADADPFTECRSGAGVSARRVLSLVCAPGGFRSAEFADGRWTPIGVPEVVPSSLILGVVDGDDGVVVTVQPPATSMATPTSVTLVWVPRR